MGYLEELVFKEFPTVNLKMNLKGIWEDIKV